MKVLKKDSSLETFDGQKIINAIKKAAFRCGREIPDAQMNAMVEAIKNRIDGEYEVPVATLHELVIATLALFDYKDVADSYAEYRYYKTTYAKTFEKIRQDADDVLRLGDRENANFDSSLISTKGSLIKGYLTKELYKQFYLSKDEKALTERGDIYIHDMRDMIFGSFNCQVTDIGNILKGGFEMSNVQYTEPKSVLSALQVIGDVTLVATAQQFGGFTLPELDKVLLPYCYKTWNRAFDEMKKWNPDAPIELLNSYADTALQRELEQGFQSLELKLNTVPCSRGDFAFTTISFGQWSADLSEGDRQMLNMIGRTILKTRREGHGPNHHPVVFPKLVYLYDQKQIDKDIYSRDLFEEAVKTSAQCMYPDYLSLSSKYGDVSRQFQEYGIVVSSMGCRAYLSEWKDPETGKAVSVGRCNIGAVSLNVPLIITLVKTQYPDNWRENFWEVLDSRLETIRQFLKKRYDVIRHQKCSTNPLAFTQGGLYKGTKHPDDEVGDLVNYMTASFGITALDEATYLWSGKRLIEEGGHFSNEVLRHMEEKIAQFKKEDGYLYAIYGTPAESLCHTQAKQYDKFCQTLGIDNVFRHTPHYSPDYFSNSFHVNVTEDITPFEKQNAEFENFHHCNGGHIAYCRLDNPENIEAVKTIIKRGMELGFYQGVNFDSAYCNDCGAHSTNVQNRCPVCGSTNLSVISRVCGYLGFSNVNGHTRFNEGKEAEWKARKSM